ncbi:glycosyltransferase family 10 domain-containing protein [Halomontanus rarus]|uniref:glycosyltransferase family 10 domain-containing protein n=1 Tax=Halomontanus rarus TaxID=3034020 RepID=UPI001A98B23C
MNVGVVPYYDNLLENEIFKHDGYDLGKTYGIDRLGYKKLQELLEEEGDKIRTFDQYDSYAEMDICIFIDPCWSVLNDLLKINNRPKLVYMMRESPAYIQFNSVANVKLFSLFFDAVLTWNGMLADHSDDFYEYKLPYLQPGNSLSSAEFEDRDLLVSIAGDKRSTHPNELYSARQAIIEYYGEQFPNSFSLYGRGWNRQSISKWLRPTRHVYVNRVYEGSIERKEIAYHQHKFAVCFENITNVRGYVTEKIFDCFRAGVVPIYWGANDITEYIPSECFIDYRKLSGPEALHKHLTSIDQAEHTQYLEAAQRFLSNKGDPFRPDTFAEHIYQVLKEIDESENVVDTTLPSWLRDDFESRVLADQITYNATPVSRKDHVRNLVGIAQRNPKLLFENPSLILSMFKR